MNLDKDFLPRIVAVQWLSHCGESSRPQVRLPTKWVDDRTAALESMFSTQWADATTVAQGRLTAHLAKHHYDAYDHWNTMFRQSQALLNEFVVGRLSVALNEGNWAASLAQAALPEIGPQVSASIGKRMTELRAAKEWDQCLLAKLLVNASRAALEITYRRRFHKAPVFFERLLEVYEAGRLPCGWDGDLDNWPEGKLMVH